MCAPRRGRGPLVARLVEKVTHGHWKTTTLIAALDCRGVRCSNVIDGAIRNRLAENEDEVEVFLLPGYSPELNPDE